MIERLEKVSGDLDRRAKTGVGGQMTEGVKRGRIRVEDRFRGEVQHEK